MTDVELAGHPLWIDLVKELARSAKRLNVLEDEIRQLEAIVFEGKPATCIAKVVRVSGLREFLEDWCECGPEYRVPISEIYAAWAAFCAAKRYDIPTTSVAFGKYMRKAVNSLRAIQVRQPDGTKPRHYLGIRLKPDCPFLS